MARYSPRHARLERRWRLRRAVLATAGYAPRHARSGRGRPRPVVTVAGLALLAALLVGLFTPARAASLEAGPAAVVAPRLLMLGTRGADVLALERRLAALRYDVGAVDGVFNTDTKHAVIAFQKVNRIGRDGIVGPITRAALARPVIPRPRYPRSGVSVEVNLTRQVLYFVSNGSITRILSISSGNGQLYTNPRTGRTARAITPTGHFRILRKINAWRTSDLGQLYRPSYFYGGYAIHGSYSVPPYPASHGCVRMTIRATDRYYHVLRIGTPVSIYR